MKPMADLSQNAEWLEWVASRPPAIQELCRQYPPDRPYCVQGGTIPGWIISYSEFEDGGVGFMVRINNPMFPREVFGLRPADLAPWEGEVPPFCGLADSANEGPEV